MRKLVPLIWAVLAACVAAIPAVRAQATTPGVSVRSVKFTYPRVDGQQGAAMETEIELDVRGSGAAGHNPRFVDAVRVALMIAVQTHGRTGTDYQYYYADATAVTLEAGTRSIRFYLPPEIVKRDGLTGDAYAFYIELSAGGQALPPQRGNLSETLRARERFDIFQKKVAETRSATDGILVEQHQFMTGLRDGRETPSVVDKNGP